MPTTEATGSRGEGATALAVDQIETSSVAHGADRWRVRLGIFARCLLAGVCIALAVPPAGWWPLAFVAFGLVDRLVADVSWKQRFRRTWLVCVVWFLITMAWMVDLTPPGYVIACISYAAYFGVAVAFVPPHRPGRWVALPGAVVLASLTMWSFPFEGVPLANLALTQAGSCAAPCRQLDSPVAQAARVGGALLVVALVVVGGIALSAAWARRWRAAGVATGVVVGATVLGWISPAGHTTGEVRVALVQGGGPQHTPVGNDDSAEVFERHLQATRDLVTTPVDLIVWPENTVSLDGRMADDPYRMNQLAELAHEKNAPILAGITEDISSTAFLNATVVVKPDGTIGDRYDKVRRVPFGEWVPVRPLLERVVGASGLPRRDAIAGTGPAVVSTPAGTFGVSISWEAFFDDRGRDAISNGGEVLLNPTNGASYWLTQVQTQQIASNRLRAIETGRWVGEAAPTGLSALIDERGNLLERADVSEQRVIEATIPRRTGTTIATTVGRWLTVLVSLLTIGAGWVLERRRRDPEPAAG